MKRSGPLRRLTPLRARSRLRQRSERTRQVYRTERVPLVESLLARYPACQLRVRCSGAPATDVHEVMRRSRGGSIVDPVNCLTACRACHTWVTENDRAAQCLGLSLPSWAERVHRDPWGAAAVLRVARQGPCPWKDSEGGCWSTDLVQGWNCTSTWLPDTLRRTVSADDENDEDGSDDI